MVVASPGPTRTMMSASRFPTCLATLVIALAALLPSVGCAAAADTMLSSGAAAPPEEPATLEPSAPPIPIIAITSKLSSGPGSIREAIDKANGSKTRVRIVSELEAGTVVFVARELPALVAYGIELDAAGLTLKGGSCVRPDGRKGCSGLVIEGPLIAIHGLSSTGFLFDGISVRGGATDVSIRNCRAFENLDDGIGISSGATNILVSGCVLERNGFRTKGKGVLVFDYAHAILRDNKIRLNRDGVTVSKGGRAELYSNEITDNFDKGLGVSAGEVSGVANVIARNGRGQADGAPPNADGLRVGIDSTVRLRDTTIIDNGDVGVVVMGFSSVVLTGGRIAGNAGVGVNVRDRAVVELHDVELVGNQGGEFYLQGAGQLKRSSGASDRDEELRDGP
jgi:hypothetical protein